MKQLFTTLSSKGPITKEDLKKLAEELDHYHLSEEDLNEILKATSLSGNEITMDDFIRFFTQVVGS